MKTWFFRKTPAWLELESLWDAQIWNPDESSPQAQEFNKRLTKLDCLTDLQARLRFSLIAELQIYIEESCDKYACWDWIELENDRRVWHLYRVGEKNEKLKTELIKEQHETLFKNQKKE